MTADETLLRHMFAAALAAADPFRAVPGQLPQRPPGRTVVVGAGKATARMAQAAEAEWGPCEGLIAVPHGAALPLQGIETVEAGHPVPDAASEAAGRRILDLAEGLGSGDLLLCLISGGGSALMAVPADGLTLADKQAVGTALLRSGATISEMNTVRKALSAIKGGRLALAAAPSACVTLAISDVPGDDPSIIASGPTVAAPAAGETALEIASRFGLALSPRVQHAMQNATGVTAAEIAQAEMRLIARPQDALVAAAEAARGAGVAPLILGDAIEGEAAEAGRVMAGIARQVARHGQPAGPPAVLISGGETTVTLGDGAGRGGRNTAFLLGFALATWDLDGVAAIACDTDGRDGSETNAGAVWTPAIRARADRRTAMAHAARQDPYGFFAEAGALVETGPTHTNVNDFRAVLIPSA